MRPPATRREPPVLTDHPVPGNRWDLLAGVPVPEPRVSVVVCHYEQPAQLARTLAALGRQTLRPNEIVVADDGSRHPPEPGPGVRVVTQPDHGFRAAAARNLGARHTTGEVLVFLDADTVPEPGFLAALTRTVARCPDALAVGRRRHADLGGLPLDADPATAPRLPEPAWLTEGYRASRDLLDADGRSFRYVISALTALRRSLFDELGGFDERFVGYGGEDWDLGYRAWNAGAVLVHERDAVGWHDGPDWAGRAEDRARKDQESMRLAALVPEPSTRGAALPALVPDVLVDLPAGLGVEATVRLVHSLLAQTHRDLRVRLPADSSGTDDLRELYAGTVRCEPWGADQLRRARARLTVCLPLPPDAVARLLHLATTHDLGAVEAVAPDGEVMAVLTTTRALGRGRRRGLDEDPAFGRAALRLDPLAPRADLAGFFAAAAGRGTREE
ncbi:glycosyltransferase [Pseudonocardia xishanensis]|uniref:Glycosyltransferase 2-like domain-containing protein n=1 Tax=Pseudonocardia xishanensis TaxID=630995 RepID=A0ABP8S408_9PSEU